LHAIKITKQILRFSLREKNQEHFKGEKGETDEITSRTSIKRGEEQA
jgi:hypothetical protein